MTIQIKHNFVSAVSDDTSPEAAGQIKPSNWNDTHSVSASASTLLGNSLSSEGPVGEIGMGSGLQLNPSTSKIEVIPGTFDIAGAAAAAQAAAIAAVENSKNGAIVINLNGDGATIVSGSWGYLSVPYPCTIVSWTITADTSGSISVDIWKLNGAIPTIANKISASAPPSLSSAQYATNSTLTGWTTTVAAGDVFGINVVGTPTNVGIVTITLAIQKF